MFEDATKDGKRRVLAVAGLVVISTASSAGCSPTSGGSPGAYAGPWSLKGAQASREQIETYAGSSHCDWESVTFLQLAATTTGAGRPGGQFVRDPQGVLPVTDPSALDELPADAVETGYVNDEGTTIWFSSASPDDVLLKTSDGSVEAWPGAVQPFGCD